MWHLLFATMQEENLDVAFGLLDEMSACGVEADTATYSTLMNLCAEARQGHQALQLMQVSGLFTYMRSFQEFSQDVAQ